MQNEKMDFTGEFSFRSRGKAIERFKTETFDLLIIGGGITGAAVARDATSRGLSVALVERQDFAYGTSSRSSKLIHGGLRYLENFEFGLVFEALSERALLLKTVPNRVRPLPFFLPVYQGDTNGRALLTMGLWLYDLLALFRTPGFHQGLSKEKMLAEIPFIRSEGLKGGFRYFDASMWDDVLTIDTLRAAQEGGAAIANYVEAVGPIWKDGQISGFRVRDRESGVADENSKNRKPESSEWDLKAHKTVVCAGPWTDELGGTLSKSWKHWLKPSKGVHLLFDFKKIPLPGAIVMSHPEDGRIVFVIPRPDFGAGVVIVGTTDGPTPKDPQKAEVEGEDIRYLLGLLTRYFPSLGLTEDDILSAYVGVRPLMGDEGAKADESGDSSVLQKVSREHHIAEGPGGTVIVAGGKYTTHRKMAEEIVDFTLRNWRENCRENPRNYFPIQIRKSDTRSPVNPLATSQALQECRKKMSEAGQSLPEEILNRYSAEAISILNIQNEMTPVQDEPAGFPYLKAQLVHTIRKEMVLHLEDFYFRRVPLFASRKDHGLPWAEALAEAWAQERGLDLSEVKVELQRLQKECAQRSAWQQKAP